VVCKHQSYGPWSWTVSKTGREPGHRDVATRTQDVLAARYWPHSRPLVAQDRGTDIPDRAWVARPHGRNQPDDLPAARTLTGIHRR